MTGSTRSHVATFRFMTFTRLKAAAVGEGVDKTSTCGGKRRNAVDGVHVVVM
jgi:hypothetical protein